MGILTLNMEQRSYWKMEWACSLAPKHGNKRKKTGWSGGVQKWVHDISFTVFKIYASLLVHDKWKFQANRCKENWINLLKLNPILFLWEFARLWIACLFPPHILDSKYCIYILYDTSDGIWSILCYMKVQGNCSKVGRHGFCCG